LVNIPSRIKLCSDNKHLRSPLSLVIPAPRSRLRRRCTFHAQFIVNIQNFVNLNIYGRKSSYELSLSSLFESEPGQTPNISISRSLNKIACALSRTMYSEIAHYQLSRLPGGPRLPKISMVNEFFFHTTLVAHTFGTLVSNDSRFSLGALVSGWARKSDVALKSLNVYMTLITRSP
jgi:hypothetical protein